MVQGAEIPIINHDQLSNISATTNQVQGNQWKAMDSEVLKLLGLGVIEKSLSERDQVISPVFLVKKPDGSFRVILNLKRFHENVTNIS